MPATASKMSPSSASNSIIIASGTNSLRAIPAAPHPGPPKLDRLGPDPSDVITQRAVLDMHSRHSITQPFEKADQLHPGRRRPVQVDLQAHLLIEMIGEHFE